ncbi:MAG: hypothetical protein ABIY52_00235 [Gemmatimonadaceae bacterium]
MTPGKGKLPSLSAALAGIPAGVQTLGPWSGRRQLFVKFADEAETATIYTADALRGELARLTGRSKYHSVAVVGRDALAEVDFLASAFAQREALPVMLDHDGQRPESLERLLQALALVQVTLDGTEGAASVERACATIALAAHKHVAHAVALVPSETLSDGPLLRIVEQVHEASAETQIVVHPLTERGLQHDRRWALLLQQAMAVHADVRVLPRWPMPAAAASTAGTGNS